MTKFFESEAVRSQESLLAEKSRLVEKYDQVNQSFKDATEALTRKANALSQIEHDFIRGKSADADIEKARQEFDAANAKVTADKRLLTLVDAALKEIDLKLAESKKHLKNERFAFCMKEHGRILAEINADQALQKKLVECFAAYRANGWQYSDDWQRFMDSLTFIKPDQSMIDAEVERFHQTHKLSRQ